LRADISGESRAVPTLLNIPALDEQRAFRLAQDGEARALDVLVQRFMPLARSVAGRYARSGEPLDDLVQVASVGLIKAIKRFDSDRGLAFSSYAVPTMAGELRRHFRDRGWAVRPPRGLQEAAMQVTKVTEELTRRLGAPPTIRQIGQALEMTDEQVLEARAALNGMTAMSFETPRSGDDEGETLGATLGDEEPGFERAEARATVDKLSVCLSEREREVIKLRFDDDLTQQEIGDIIGVSQMQVSRILRRATDQLRETMAFEDPRRSAS
jgi:RNA polymerase sigma-B factor